jgi:tRNA(Ile)-lysidine synthase
LRRRTPLIAISDQIIGWGAIDCREEGLIPHSLQWEWRFVPRNTTDSTVS